MRGPSFPFAWICGRPYLVLNFSLDPTEPPPALPQALGALLRQQGLDDVLLLRPLSDSESASLRHAVEDAEVDAWAHVVGESGR